MKVGEIIAKQLEKLGVDTTSEDLKSIVGISVEVPEALSLKLDSFITEDAAKNNSKIKGHFVSAFADGLEKNIFDKMKEFGLPEDQIAEIKNLEKSSGKRIETALERLVAAKEAQAKFKKSGDADGDKAYKEQIDKLIKDLSDSKENFKKERDQLLAGFEIEMLDNESATEFLSKNWSNAFSEKADDRMVIANTYLKNELQQMDAKLVRDKESRKVRVVQAKNPELDYLDNTNKKVTFESLVSKIGTDKKLFAVSASTGQGTEQKIVGGQQPQGTSPRTNNATLDALRKSQADQAQNI